jgi:hypothetical protein
MKYYLRMEVHYAIKSMVLFLITPQLSEKFLFYKYKVRLQLHNIEIDFNSTTTILIIE